MSAPERPFYDFDEYERLLEAAKAIDSRTYVFALLGGSAGLRVGEIIALEQSDVDLRRGMLNVQRAEWMGHVDIPKSGRGRRVPLTARLAEALRAIRHIRGPRVLYRDDGTTVTAKLLKGWLRSAERRAVLPIKETRTSCGIRSVATSRCEVRRRKRSRSSPDTPTSR